MSNAGRLIPVKSERTTLVGLFRSLERSFSVLDAAVARLSEEEKTSLHLLKTRVGFERNEAAVLLARHVQLDNNEDMARIRVVQLKSRLEGLVAGARMLAENYTSSTPERG